MPTRALDKKNVIFVNKSGRLLINIAETLVLQGVFDQLRENFV